MRLEFARPARSLATFVLLLSAALAAPATPLSARTGTIVGQVVDGASGRPVAGAVVQLDVATRAVADGEGRFTVRRVPPGTYDVVISRVGYQRQGERWTVAAGRTLAVTVRLAEAPVALEGVEGRARTAFERALDRSLNAIPASTRVFREVDFERSVSPTAADFVRYGTRVMRISCPSRSPVRDCVRKRGRTLPLGVVIDERRALGGLAELETLPLSEVARVEVIDGAVVRVYTLWYMEQAERRGLIPMP